MEKKTIIGIDYSMNSPGICVYTPKVQTIYGFINKFNGNASCGYGNINVKVLQNVDGYKSQIERFDKLARKVMLAINTHTLYDAVVYIESYSMASKGQVFHIAENTAVLKHYLYKSGIEIIEVAPTTLKKYAAGSGRAQKEDMYDAFVSKTGFNLMGMLTPTKKKLGNPLTDLVDAYFLAEYGLKDQYETGQQQENGKN